MSKFLHFFCLFVLTFFHMEVRSQSSIYNDYGKNRIQFKLFKWKYLSSENFNIYYHDNGKRYAEIAWISESVDLTIEFFMMIVIPLERFPD